MEKKKKQKKQFYKKLDQKTANSFADDDEMNVARTIAKEEVIQALKAAKPKKAPGPDAIMNEMLKTAAESELFVQATTKLFNSFLENEKTPINWGKATVTLLEKGSLDKEGNAEFRPISLTSNFSKIFEHIIARRMQELIENYASDKFATHFGFRAGRSCGQVLYSLKTLVDKIKANRFVVAVTKVDFQKAFDTVSPWRALDRLGHIFGRKNGKLIRLLPTIIQNRKIACTSRVDQAPYLKCLLGIPQGGKLSTLIFNALVVDALLQIPTSKSVPDLPAGLQFADDINMISVGKTRQECIKHQLAQKDELINWVTNVEMILKPSKSFVCFFTNKKALGHQPLKPYGTVMEDGSMEVLGGFLDKRWQLAHTMKKIKAATQTLTRLARLGLKPDHRRLYYKACVESHLRYGAAALLDLNKAETARLRAQCKRAAVQIIGAYKITSPDNVFKLACIHEPAAIIEAACINVHGSMERVDIWKSICNNQNLSGKQNQTKITPDVIETKISEIARKKLTKFKKRPISPASWQYKSIYLTK